MYYNNNNSDSFDVGVKFIGTKRLPIFPSMRGRVDSRVSTCPHTLCCVYDLVFYFDIDFSFFLNEQFFLYKLDDDLQQEFFHRALFLRCY